MALQAGIIKITGTIDNLTFYEMKGKYYVRKKSSLTRKKFLNAPSFERTRMHSTQLALASKIASELYQPIKKENRNVDLFRSMVGRAKTLLHKGYEIDQINKIITEEMIQPITDAKVKTQPITPKKEKGFSQQISKLNNQKPNNQTFIGKFQTTTPKQSANVPSFVISSKARICNASLHLVISNEERNLRTIFRTLLSLYYKNVTQ